MTHRISKKSIFLIDGSSFLYRAYYGLRPLHTSKGETVHAVYGFCRMIKKLIDTFTIEHVVIVWDSKGKTQRHEIYPTYKATRQVPPSDIFQQKELIQEFADMVGIAQLSKVGIEADDLIYSCEKIFSKKGYQSVFVTSDKDMRQALTQDSLIFDPFKNMVMDCADVEKRYGFEIEKIPFYFSIVGDSSDNIPGVKGIGDKGATQLVQKFANLDDMYQRLDEIDKDRIKGLLLASKEEAYVSLKLFLLHEYKLDITVQDTEFKESNWIKALPFFQKLEFNSLIKDLEKHFQSEVSAQMQLNVSKKQLHEENVFVEVVTLEGLLKLCELIKLVGFCAIDTETDGLDPMQANLVGVSIAVEQGQAFYIPLRHIQGEQIPFDIFVQYFGPILHNSAIKKYMHHAKFDQLVLLQAGLPVQGVVFDTMIAASLVTKEWEKNGLKELSEQFFSETMLTFQETMKQHKAKDFSQLPLDAATKYAAADAHQTLKLVTVFQKELEQQDMHDLYYGIELPVNDVLVAMQQEGIICDTDVLIHLRKQVDVDLKNIEKKIHVVAGKEINLNSPKQVRELLFETLQLAPQKKSGTGKVYSTDAQVLEILAQEHEIPSLLLAYRELFKLKSTYIDALPTYINPQTNRIHTSWNQTIVVTGRISSSSPNLQNIPTQGLQYGKEYDVDVRSAFKAKKGWSFISADYSQIELRILAQLSKDKNLMQAFLNGKDIHTQTAAKMFEVDESEVTQQQRAIGKRLNFSILYGLTAYGLSREMLISYAQSKQYIELYFQQYPGVLVWMQEVVDFVKKTGYTKTLYGRRRYLPGIYERNRTLYDVARRIAINTPAQGTAAEITKIGMIRFQQAVHQAQLNAKIVLQIHDELLVTCPDDEVEKTVNLLKRALVEAVQWEIPLDVSIRSGKSWRDVTK